MSTGIPCPQLHPRRSRAANPDAKPRHCDTKIRDDTTRTFSSTGLRIRHHWPPPSFKLPGHNALLLSKQSMHPCPMSRLFRLSDHIASLVIKLQQARRELGDLFMQRLGIVGAFALFCQPVRVPGERWPRCSRAPAGQLGLCPAHGKTAIPKHTLQKTCTHTDTHRDAHSHIRMSRAFRQRY